MFEETPRSQRKRISFIGRTNAGKSSLINAITNQKVSIVSSIPGTTTDRTEKAMEILPAGPVLLTDTPGIDDFSPLAAERLKITEEMLSRSDLVFFVFQPPYEGFFLNDSEINYIKYLEKEKIPFAFLFNKWDMDKSAIELLKKKGERLFLDLNGKDIPAFICSAKEQIGIEDIKGFIGITLTYEEPVGILKGIVKEGESLLLVIPVNKAYPRGRLKPLQVQVMREALERHIKLMVIQPEEIEDTLNNLKNPPALVITDAQVFKDVIDKIPSHIPITSFSLLFARYKGDLKSFVSGFYGLNSLSDGDTVAIVEACTHHRMEGDMARDLLPNMISEKTGKRLKFKLYSGIVPLIEDNEKIKAVFHCGGCMLTRRDMMVRIEKFGEKGIQVVNYGVFISGYYNHLERALSPFEVSL